jgi:hypothetical protein
MGIWPSGVTIYRVTPTVWQFILKKYHPPLSWMYFWGYFALSNSPNWQVICIIPIFGVIFGPNLGIWPPGVTIYNVTPYCLAINFEEIPSYFVLNVFLWLFCIIRWSKLCSYLHNTNIWGHFGQNWGIWLPGVTIYRLNPHCFAINFEEIPSSFVLNVFLWLLCIIKWSKLVGYLHNTNIWGHFCQNLGIWASRMTIYRITPYCLAINFEEIASCFVLNVFL